MAAARDISQVLKERRGERFIGLTKFPPANGAWPPTPYDSIEERSARRIWRERLGGVCAIWRPIGIDIVQLHTWTRAWNRNPTALEVLRNFRRRGRFGHLHQHAEHDQNSLI